MNKLYAVAYAVVWVLMKLLFPWRVHGRERLPDGGVVLCGNHTSFLDPVYVVCALGRKVQLRVMAKAELFRIPVLGFILKKAEMIPVNRGKSDVAAVKEGIRVLRNQNPLLIFPEGTRVKEGEESVAHAGAVVLAARADVPVMPIYISPKKRIFRRVDVTFGEPYRLEYSGRKPTAEENQALANELLQRIRALGEDG